MSLQKIITSVQLICEAIASVVNIDVTIVDQNRIRLAGTGMYRDSIGEAVNENSAFSYALRESVGFIIENPGEHQACMNCDCKNRCEEHAEVCCPIRLDGVTIGVIGLIAFKEEQRMVLVKNQENLLAFLDRMADLISTKLKEQESHEAIELLAEELEVVIDSIDTSLLAVDHQGRVIRANKKCRQTFGQKKLTHIHTLFSEAAWTEIKSSTKNKKDIYHTFVNGLSGVYDLSLINIHGSIKGYIITIKTIDEAIKSVNEMMLDPITTGFDQIIGQSPELLKVKALAEKVAPSASTVLILGESGTGKELFARAIHYISKRTKGPFVAINCAAIPDQLLESELFGYEEGAFTGAKRGGKLGKFQLANRGTLFLDEIGDMPLHLQAKLLRVLQEKKVERLGGKSSVDIDVRVIAATHQNLDEKVLEGSFRQDLYYRLNVIPLMIPSLRERPEDLLLTAHYLVQKWCDKLEKQPLLLSIGFTDALMAHHWAGNVRELENAIEYAVNVCDAQKLEVHHLPKRILQHHLVDEPVTQPKLSTVIRPLDDLEAEAIKAAIAHYGRHLEGLESAAAALGISRATLYRKIKRYEVDL